MKQFARDFIQDLPFGVKLAIKRAAIMPFKSESDRSKYYQDTVLNWLSDLLKNIEISNLDLTEHTNYGPVWFCWWQGQENMPPIVRSCWQQINKNVKNRPVILITQENFEKYVVVPEIILYRLKSGQISLTHFSDILRSCLIYQNGGYWFDATIYTSMPIDELLDNKSFYTLQSMYTDRYISQGRWCGFNIGGYKGHPLFKYMIDAFVYYWENFDRLVDYFLIDYIIAIAYQKSSYIKKCIDKDAIPSDSIYTLQHSLSKPFTNDYLKIMEMTSLHKLTWKFSEVKVTKGTLRAWIEGQYTI